jgi:hypothetical protein
MAAVFARLAGAVEGAAPHLFRPMYAEANMGHPSREGGFVLRSYRSADENGKPLSAIVSILESQSCLRATFTL